MADSAVRFGLIGYGAWGQHHAATIARTEGAQLVAIAEPSASVGLLYFNVVSTLINAR